MQRNAVSTAVKNHYQCAPCVGSQQHLAAFCPNETETLNFVEAVRIHRLLTTAVFLFLRDG
jgi:hypothetical protein